MENPMNDYFDEIDQAIRAVVPGIVMRYREAGVLTWALLHHMEEEVFSKVLQSGEHDKVTLNMMRSAPAFRYPKDDGVVSFAGHSLVPIAFGEIEKAWNCVH
jgi:hypothetical protein